MKNVDDIYPLTPTQEGILYQTLRDPRPELYFEQVRYDLIGPIEPQRLRHAWERVVRRHPALRTIFVREGVDRPLQVVRTTVELPWTELDWRHDGAEATASAARLDQLATELRQVAFDLSRAPNLRLTMIRVADDRTHLVWDFPHILLDGWSASRVVAEVIDAYHGPDGSPTDAAPGFSSHLAWLATQDQAAGAAHWRRVLDGFEAPTPLRIGTEPGDPGFRHGRHHSRFSPGVSLRLGEFARRHRLTVNSVIQGGWGLVQAQYAGTSDVVVGVTTSGRPPEVDRVDEIVGMFLTTLPLRVTIRSDQPVAEWLGSLQRQMLDLQQYQYSSLAEIQSRAEVPPGGSLFDVVLVFENYPAAPRSEGDLSVEVADVFEQSPYGITLLIGPGDEIEIVALYDRARFTPAQIDELMGRFERAVEQLVDAEPGRRLADVDLLTDDERRRLVELGEGPAVRRDEHETVDGLFLAAVADRPDAVAVIGDEGSVTRAELEARAGRLAEVLRARGVGPEVPVGVAIPRSTDMVVALLAVVRAGGVYVPLDPDYPSSRIEMMIEDSGAILVLTTEDTDSTFAAHAPPTLPVHRAGGLDASAPSPPGPNHLDADRSLFVTFTSGSTGRPKPVQGHHRGVINRCRWQWAAYPFEPGETVAAKTTLNFVDHLWEIWGALLGGAPLLLVPEDTVRNPPAFLDLLAHHRVRRVVLVPSLIRVLLETHPDIGRRLPDLTLWTFSGEPVDTELAEQFRRLLPHATLLDFYGMSEATIDVTTYDDRWTEGPDVPIGRPIDNMRARVLDEHDRLVPLGVPGQICAGGVGLSDGYWRRPDLTDERFLDDPYLPGQRLYRTGDIGRWRADGMLEYLGRSDDQVKVRGARVELAEVEASFRRQADVDDVLVVARSLQGDTRLVAYLRGSTTAEAALDAARSVLAPSMVPAHVVLLDEFPLTPNGKVDRRSLPDPVVRHRRVTGEVSEDVAAMIRLWETTIGVDGIGPDDDFFDVGGHSLLAVRLFSRIDRHYDANLPLALLFEAPTPRSLVGAIERSRGGGDPGADPWTHLVEITRTPGRPFFCVHGGGGNVLSFRRLAELLGSDIGFVGIQASGVDGVLPMHASIEEMRDHYLAELRAYQPTGPYTLGGYSGGGIVAIAIAQRLEELGETVDQVVLLDTVHPTMRVEGIPARDHLAKLRAEGPAYLGQRLRSRVQRRRRRRRDEEIARMDPADGDVVPFEIRERQLLANFHRLLDSFDPGTYDGRVLLVVAGDSWIYGQVPPGTGWTGAVSDLEMVTVGGEHLTLLEEEHVGAVADVLRRRLAETLTGPDGTSRRAYSPSS